MSFWNCQGMLVDDAIAESPASSLIEHFFSGGWNGTVAFRQVAEGQNTRQIKIVNDTFNVLVDSKDKYIYFIDLQNRKFVLTDENGKEIGVLSPTKPKHIFPLVSLLKGKVAYLRAAKSPTTPSSRSNTCDINLCNNKMQELVSKGQAFNELTISECRPCPPRAFKQPNMTMKGGTWTNNRNRSDAWNSIKIVKE